MRAVRYIISPDTLFMVLQRGDTVRFRGIPPDATLRNYGFDWETNSFCLVVEDDSFEDIPENRQLPVDVSASIDIMPIHD